jgi:ATP-dependent protease ClpP protease subunit
MEKKMLKKILLMSMLLLGINTVCYSKTLEVNEKRTVRVVGVVEKDIMTEAEQLNNLSAESKDPIYIIINSPGGSVAFGMQFLTAMKIAKNRGSRLVCLVPNLAASMGFHFLAECDERYALAYSLLLWHPMKIGGMFVMLSADQMEYMVKVMRSWEVPLNNKLMEQLDVSKDLFYYHYTHETLFTPGQLAEIAPNFITVVDDVKGVPNLFKMEKDSDGLDFRKRQAPVAPNTPSVVPPAISPDTRPVPILIEDY